MLKYAIAHLQHVETDFNRREAMVRTVINAQKQAKTSERIRFLLECKRAKLYPTFITNSVRNISYKYKKNAVVEKRREVFCRQLLNESIKEAFRTQAFRLRESRRLQREVAVHPRHGLVHYLASEVYEEARQASAATLSKKFHRLCQLKTEVKSRDPTVFAEEESADAAEDVDPADEGEGEAAAEVTDEADGAVEDDEVDEADLADLADRSPNRGRPADKAICRSLSPSADDSRQTEEM